jgi:hypothetical protein
VVFDVRVLCDDRCVPDWSGALAYVLMVFGFLCDASYVRAGKVRCAGVSDGLVM